MSNHAIEVLVETAMNSINEMVDVNTIIGEPIETKSGMVIIPISKVCFGFAAGGSEFKGETIDEYKRKEKEEEVKKIQSEIKDIENIKAQANKFVGNLKSILV